MRILFAAVVLAGVLSVPAFAHAQQSATGTTQSGGVSGVLGTPAAQPATTLQPAPVTTAPVTDTAEAQKNSANVYRVPQEYQAQFNAMTPQEREALVRQAYKQWNTMSAADKTKLHDIAVANFKSLSPQEQRALEGQALEQWRNMTPQQRQELKDAFPDILQGDLVLSPSDFPTN